MARLEMNAFTALQQGEPQCASVFELTARKLRTALIHRGVELGEILLAHLVGAIGQPDLHLRALQEFERLIEDNLPVPDMRTDCRCLADLRNTCLFTYGANRCRCQASGLSAGAQSRRAQGCHRHPPLPARDRYGRVEDKMQEGNGDARADGVGSAGKAVVVGAFP
jgi:hypothetical protein